MSEKLDNTHEKLIKGLDQGEISRRALLGIGLGSAGIVGAFFGLGFLSNSLANLFDTDIKVSMPDGEDILGAKAPEMTGANRPEFTRIEGVFDMFTNTQVGVVVGVKGISEGSGFIHWITAGNVGDGHFSKLYFGDALAATDQKVVNDSLVVVQDDNGDTVSVTCDLHAFDLIHHRIDFMQYENFLKIGADASVEEVEKIKTEYKNDGSHYDPLGGFSCDHACNTDTAELFQGGQFLAQYAMAVDSSNAGILETATKKYQRDLMLQLADNYKCPIDKVNVRIVYSPGQDPNVELTSDEVKQIYLDRIKKIYDDNFGKDGVGLKLFAVAPELRYDDSKQPYVYCEFKEGAKLTVALNGIRLDGEVQSLIMSNIREDYRTQGLSPEEVGLEPTDTTTQITQG